MFTSLNIISTMQEASSEAHTDHQCLSGHRRERRQKSKKLNSTTHTRLMKDHSTGSRFGTLLSISMMQELRNESLMINTYQTCAFKCICEFKDLWICTDLGASLSFVCWFEMWVKTAMADVVEASSHQHSTCNQNIDWILEYTLENTMPWLR